MSLQINSSLLQIKYDSNLFHSVPLFAFAKVPKWLLEQKTFASNGLILGREIKLSNIFLSALLGFLSFFALLQRNSIDKNVRSFNQCCRGNKTVLKKNGSFGRKDMLEKILTE
ncbi:hypothetical protein CDAR_284041 [Caerostris darwini]|uniref:Uncharacterized protein n=1 Tax=Caerostris darwini TaxID=1538125 RepID=A0AAV4PLV4_9ARAC|nr:hypothetical protein CDAR_284041 [Caerostris darwini]